MQAGVPGLSLGMGGLADKARLVLCPLVFTEKEIKKETVLQHSGSLELK